MCKCRHPNCPECPGEPLVYTVARQEVDYDGIQKSVESAEQRYLNSVVNFLELFHNRPLDNCRTNRLDLMLAAAKEYGRWHGKAIMVESLLES